MICADDKKSAKKILMPFLDGLDNSMELLYITGRRVKPRSKFLVEIGNRVALHGYGADAIVGSVYLNDELKVEVWKV